MNQLDNKKMDIVDTTDCLEAVSVLKCRKNFLFVIALVCLLILQLAFWANHFGYIDKSDCGTVVCPTTGRPMPVICPMADKPAMAPSAAPASLAAVAVTGAEAAADQAAPAERAEAVAESASEALQAAKEEPAPSDKAAATAGVVCCPGATTASGAQPRWSLGRFDAYLPNCMQTIVALRIVNFVLLLVVGLYVLSLFAAAQVSLAGRLGGVAHVYRAFFRAMLALVLLVPWQVLMPGVLLGAMVLPTELLCGAACPAAGAPIPCMVVFYLRFCGLWLLVFLLLCSAQIRSARWSHATLRRLGLVQ
ncbi:MAG TPA: hypothetical protein ENN87_04220 [Phycisphaerales bacterium]|nr:hypothetical protein [Phycisphaerales bacterium]